MKKQINEIKRMQQLAGIINEGFLDNVAASIKGKSEQGKLAQDLLTKMGITKNPAEIFSLGMQGGGAGPFENEVQDYLSTGGDIQTKIPFSKDLKSSSGGAIFKETYTFDFSKDIPTMKSGGKFIWNIKGGKWEPFGDKDGNEGKEEPIDIESMKKESDAEQGTYVPQMSMMTIADAAKIWPDSHPGTPYGYGKNVLAMVKFMEDKKITKMTPEDVKEFENKEKSDKPQAAPQAESLDQLNEEMSAEDVKVGEIYIASMPTQNDGSTRIDVKVKVVGPAKELSEDHFVIEPLESKRYTNPVSKGENEFSKGKHYNIEAKYLKPATNESFDQLDEIVDRVLEKLRNKK